MAPLDIESQFAFLISCIKHNKDGKIDFVKVSNEQNIVSKGAAAKRYERLMKAHDIAPKNALASSGAGAGAGDLSSPLTASTPGSAKKTPKTPVKAKKPAAKKRKVEVDSGSEDEIPPIKKEPKKEPKSEKIVKNEDTSDAGSFMISDTTPEAPPSIVKKEGSSNGDEDDVKAGVAAGYGDLVDNCHACATQQPPMKPEPGLKLEHAPSPHTHPSLDHGGVFSNPMIPTQPFGYGANNPTFQTRSPPEMLLRPMTRTEASPNTSGVFPSGSWLQIGPEHYYYDSDHQ